MCPFVTLKKNNLHPSSSVKIRHKKIATGGSIQSSLYAVRMDNLFLSQKASPWCPVVIVRRRRLVYFVRHSTAWQEQKAAIPQCYRPHRVVLTDDVKPWMVLPLPKQ